MKRSLCLPAALSALLLGTAIAAGIGTSQRIHAPVYAVADVQARLASSPGAWIGRTVRVRGMVLPSSCVPLEAGRSTPCRDRSAYLLDRDGADLLPVVGWQPDPLLTTLRRLPLAGGLVPAPQRAGRHRAPGSV